MTIAGLRARGKTVEDRSDSWSRSNLIPCSPPEIPPKTVPPSNSGQRQVLLLPTSPDCSARDLKQCSDVPLDIKHDKIQCGYGCFSRACVINTQQQRGEKNESIFKKRIKVWGEDWSNLISNQRLKGGYCLFFFLNNGVCGFFLFFFLNINGSDFSSQAWKWIYSTNPKPKNKVLT